MIQKLKQLYNDPRIWLAKGLALLMISLFLASSRQLAGWEETVLSWFYNLPSIFTPLFLGITFLGSIWATAGIVAFCLWRRQRRFAFELALTAGTVYLVTTILKVLVNRPRPSELLPQIMSRELFLGSNLGFPSGHTAVSTVVALLAMPFLPNGWRWLAPAWIILVGLSRLHLGVHAPLDIIGGIGVGLACAGFIKIIMTYQPDKPAAKL